MAGIYKTTYFLEITTLDGADAVAPTELLDTTIGYDEDYKGIRTPVGTVRDFLWEDVGRSAAWYGCIEDMEELSKDWPDLLFKLWGQSQDWALYAYRGESLLKNINAPLAPGELPLR